MSESLMRAFEGTVSEIHGMSLTPTLKKVQEAKLCIPNNDV